MSFVSSLLMAISPYFAAPDLSPLLYQISPQPLSFGVVACGQDSMQKLRIENTGRSAIVVMRRSYVGSPRFQVTDDGSGKWAAGQGDSHHVTVIFHPTVPKRIERGTVSVRIEYHDQQISAERARILRLMDPEIDLLTRTFNQLNQAGPATDIIDMLKLKADLQRQQRLAKIQADIEHDQKIVNSLEAQKIHVLKEYREGAFCSGCGQTRSQIEEKGEQFPHPDQHIVPATPEQLRAKEVECDQKIETARQRVDGHRSRVQQADATFLQRVQDLDKKRDDVRADWEQRLKSIDHDRKLLADRRKRILAELDEYLNYSETKTIKIEGSCKNAP